MNKAFFALLLVFCLACTPSQEPVSEHMGCDPSEIETAGGCVLAEENNAEIFDELDRELVETEDVMYFEDVTGFLAQPKEPGNYPGIVMIHEWWGLNDNIKNMATLLAQQGYVVLAVDLYKGNVATESADARAYMMSINQEEANANMQAAVSYLKSKSATSIGSMGWCFGGGQSLQLAISGQEMDATVIYYGHVNDDKEKLSKITWPVLGIFAEKDQGIPVDSVNKFETALTEVGVDNNIIIYPNVDHAFANPSGARYAPQETKDAWEKTVSFFKDNLQ